MGNEIGAKMACGALVTDVYEAYEAGMAAGRMTYNVEYAEVVKRNNDLQEKLIQAHDSINRLIKAFCK
jgi:hypothetical protein